MFTAFDLFLEDGKINDTINLLDYTEKGRRHLEEKKDLVYKPIKEYIINGIVDGTKIENDWFPTDLKVDIFISHSHKDEDLVLGLAGWIYDEFKLECFVDSCIWGYVDDLLSMINNKFSDMRTKNNRYIYNHEKCNTASKHVNTMLSIALQRMIDKAEVTILVNTNNSIDKYEDIYETATFSPWINIEIFCTQIIRHRPISEYRNEIKQVVENFHRNGQPENELKIAYKLSLANFFTLRVEDLLNWYENLTKNNDQYNYALEAYPLDKLYKIVCPKEFDGIMEICKSELYGE